MFYGMLIFTSQRANFHMQNGPMQEERDRIMQAGGGKEAVVEGFPAKW
jgi:hypothetical protein